MNKELTEKIALGLKPTWYYIVVHKRTGTYSVRRGDTITDDYYTIDFDGKYYGSYSEDKAIDLLRNLLETVDLNGVELVKDERQKEKLINNILV